MASHQIVEYIEDEKTKEQLVFLHGAGTECVKISHIVDDKVQAHVHVKITRTVLGDFIKKEDLKVAFKWMFGYVSLEAQDCDGITKLIDGRNGNVLGAIVTASDEI